MVESSKGQPFAKQQKFLVVEDAVELVSVWKILFRKVGYEARFCTTGRAAIAMIEEGYEPDVMMTDYYLPDITGLDLIDRIRELQPDVHCLIVTGNKDDTFIRTVKNKKDVTLLFKPVRFDVLEGALNAMQQKRSS